MDAWQKCPICDGTGIIYENNTTTVYSSCPHCLGQRVISTVTGLPPNYEPNTNATGDFRDTPTFEK